MDYNQMALDLHERHTGKIEVTSKVPLKTVADMSTAYTPGVAEPCRRIAADALDVYRYTAKGNMVAVVSDGSAVLGLGNIGALAALPVMEGKSVLFKEFAGVDAFPICLATQDVEEIVAAVRNIAPSFGGINLEDISAPRCFEVEEKLKQILDIPVFHDDQHGTAVVVLAGLLNACRVTGKDLATAKIVMNGIGAAGTAICKILLARGAKNIVLCDRAGIINKNDKSTCFTWMHEQLAEQTNPENLSGSLSDALVGADVFIGVSAANLVSDTMVKSMNEKAIIFALANPNPEIAPEAAKAAGAAVVCSGRSDYPNQVNNVLAFPGIFKGTFSVRATCINEEMKLAAAEALAAMITPDELCCEKVIPSALDRSIADVVAKAVAEAARTSGVATC